MSKDILFNQEARQKLKDGVDKLANAVAATLGPQGRNVIIEKKFGSPLVTKDGVTVAQEIQLKDPIENMGAQMVREVASKTSDVAGDGTTTATVLAQAIFREGLKNVTAGANPMDLKRGIDAAVLKIVEGLKEIKTDVGSDKEKITQVGTISANNDRAIGELLSSAMEKVGKDGVITIEEAKGTQTSLDVVEGMQFDRGYISPYFVTDGDRLECNYKNAKILLYDKRIIAVKEILPILDAVSKSKTPLLIIAEDVEGEALATMVINKLKGMLNVVAVKAPAFGDRRKAILEDIAITTGATVVTEEQGLTLSSPLETLMRCLGTVKTLKVDKDNTTLVEGAGTPEVIKAKIAEIRALIENTASDYDKKKLQERLAKLTGGVAVVKIGAMTEAELKEKKARVEDALHATRAAVEEGIVPGGGVAYIRCLKKLDDLVFDNFDQMTGVDIIRKAIKEPLVRIVNNAGLEGVVVMNEVLKSSELMYGFNAQAEQYEDLFKAGIIDPTKVSRVALENAASIAGLLLTTEVTIVELPEENKDTQQPQQGMY